MLQIQEYKYRLLDFYKQVLLANYEPNKDI